MQIVKINQIKPNPRNPRTIKDFKFKKLVKSIQEFPDMLNKRPLIVFTDSDGKFVVLGGNMRLKALKELNFEDIPVIIADEWTEEQKNEFLIKDNVGFGDWDWDDLANTWDEDLLTDWGMDIPKFMDTEDYSILDDEDLDDKLDALTGGIKKAIQIEFEFEHYDEATELVKFWRSQDLYLGGFLIEKLKEEKDKI
jgi:ParB-like chromosome segregation protein Spo0J